MRGIVVKKLPKEVWVLIALSLASVFYYTEMGNKISGRTSVPVGGSDLGFGSGLGGLGNSITGITYLVTGFFQLMLAVYLYKGSRGWWLWNTVFLYLSVGMSIRSTGNLYLLAGEILACVLSVTPATRRYFTKSKKVENPGSGVVALDQESLRRKRKRKIVVSLISSSAMIVVAFVVWKYMLEPTINSLKASYGSVGGLGL